MKVYTRKGDKGKTGLLGGGRVYKYNFRIEGYGNIDELNSHIGLILDYIDLMRLILVNLWFWLIKILE